MLNKISVLLLILLGLFFSQSTFAEIKLDSKYSGSDIFFVDNIRISTTATSIDDVNPSTQIKSNRALVGNDSVNEINSKDSIIYYMAHIGVINPSKKKYNVKITCKNAEGKVVLVGEVQRTFSGYTNKLGENILHVYEQTLGLYWKPNALINGQNFPLETGDYYIILMVENTILGITKFHYEKLDKI